MRFLSISTWKIIAFEEYQKYSPCETRTRDLYEPSHVSPLGHRTLPAESAPANAAAPTLHVALFCSFLLATYRGFCWLSLVVRVLSLLS